MAKGVLPLTQNWALGISLLAITDQPGLGESGVEGRIGSANLPCAQKAENLKYLDILLGLTSYVLWFWPPSGSRDVSITV